jgi:hypothetical protein
MTRSNLLTFALVASVVSAAVFLGVAVHEWNYANDHPHAYGPARVIAWMGVAGALGSAAVAALAFTLNRHA